jgi:hypothetical protein
MYPLTLYFGAENWEKCKDGWAMRLPCHPSDCTVSTFVYTDGIHRASSQNGYLTMTKVRKDGSAYLVCNKSYKGKAVIQ